MNQKYSIIYLVRHGETDWNFKKLIQGETDIPLNKAGEQQAKELGEALKNIKFDAVYSSDLSRAKKTAGTISLDRKLAIETSKLLRERRFGKLEGKPWAEMDEIHQIWEDLDKQQRLVFKPYEGYENDEEVISRLIIFLREVAASRLDQTVLVTTHGGIMRVLLNHLSDKTYFRGAVSNLGYIKLKSDGVDFFIEELAGIKESSE